MEYPEPVARLIEELRRLPGLGPKSAQRVAFFLLKGRADDNKRLAAAIETLSQSVGLCERCNSFTDLPVCFICTDPSRVDSQVCVVEEPGNIMAVDRSGGYRGRYHVLHVSSGQTVELVRAAKAEGVRVTAECTPQHLVLTDEACAGLDPVFKMNPPLREQRDVVALRAGILDGTIDAIATDHAPHAPETKAAPFEEAPPGMLGVETALAVVLTTLVEPGVLTLGQALGALAWRPARVSGLDALGHGGPIEAGRPANLCVIDPAVQWVVEPARLASRAVNSPWADWKLTGKVRHTILRGTPTVRDAEPTQ